MKSGTLADKFFSFLMGIATLIVAILIAIPKVFGPVWSWEGFFWTLQTKGNEEWLQLLVVTVALLGATALIVRTPNYIGGYLLHQKIMIRGRLQLSEKKKLSFCIKPQQSYLALSVGGREFSLGRWGKSGKLKWCVLCICLCALVMLSYNIPLTARWFEAYHVVAHAGGTSPNGNEYVNSLECFESNYQKGFRVFEGDLCLTEDDALVLTHYWGGWSEMVGVEYMVPTHETFMRTKLYGTETPMDIDTLINLMATHEDMYFMTDFKNSYQKDDVTVAFRQIVQSAKRIGRTDILNRFIIQNHHKDFKGWVDEVYSFDNWLYTWYSIPNVEDGLPQNMVAYCKKENIPVITMWHNMANDEWLELTRSHNIKIFVHTVNDITYANDLIASGVAGIYTDDITPEQLALAG